MPPLKRDGQPLSPRKERPKRSCRESTTSMSARKDLSIEEIRERVKAQMRRQHDIDSPPPHQEPPRLSWEEIKAKALEGMRKAEERKRNVVYQSPHQGPSELSFQEIQSRIKAQMRKQEMEKRQSDVGERPSKQDPPKLSFQDIQVRAKEGMRKMYEKRHNQACQERASISSPTISSAAETTQDTSASDVQQIPEEPDRPQSRTRVSSLTVAPGKASEPKVLPEAQMSPPWMSDDSVNSTSDHGEDSPVKVTSGDIGNKPEKPEPISKSWKDVVMKLLWR